MWRAIMVCLLGFLLAVVPFLGIPDTWKSIFVLVAGFVLMMLGYGLLRVAFYERTNQQTSATTETSSDKADTP